jgi:hypothetical protein
MLPTWTIVDRIESDIADVRRRAQQAGSAEVASALAEAEDIVKALGGDHDDVAILRAWRALDRAERALSTAQRIAHRARRIGDGARSVLDAQPAAVNRESSR